MYFLSWKSLPQQAKTLIIAALVSTVFGAGSALGTVFWLQSSGKLSGSFQPLETSGNQKEDPNSDQPISYTSKKTPPANKEKGFAEAAKRGSPSVVFIRTVSNYRSQQDEFWSFWDFYGRRRGPIASAGSGVIISEDGYIVTNKHVIEKADKITVTLQNKHRYQAKVVGQDPNTDLALLKVDEKGLPAIEMGNSENLDNGEWVLAVGNPLNLTSTITAGIVSAQGRNINVVDSRFPIESFIQTDAAINPGNSGGALLNAEGKLIGINTAIKSETGAYTGYGFAIPVNIVRKVVNDLIKYGTVQQAFFGASVVDMDEGIAQQIGTKDLSGIFVEEVNTESAASDAGLQAGDVIIGFNGHPIDAKAEFLEQLAYHRPGDKVTLRYKRDGEVYQTKATLQNRNGGTGIVKDRGRFSEELGAKITPLSKVERQRMNVQGGFRISNIRNGMIRNMGLNEGFVILAINGNKPSSVQELERMLTQTRGRIVIDGINANGGRVRHSFITYGR